MPGIAPPATEEIIDPATIDPSTVIVEGEATVVTPDANAADPSTADPEGAKEPASLLDVVKSAVEPAAPAEASPAPTSDPVEAETAQPAEASAEPAVEDDTKLPFHNHPRWQAVIAERDSLKDPAERWGHVESFMTENRLSSEEVAEGYEIMALLKSGDPAKLSQAREWFVERLDTLDGMLGNVLPTDLQERVDSGLLDEDGALELAQARAAATLRATAATAETEASAADKARADQAAISTAMVTAVDAWEAETKRSDPDYSKKAALVQDRCLRIVRESGTPPTTAEAAKALAVRAYGEITAEFKAALPKPKPVAASPAGSSATTAAAPKTLREAIAAAV